MTILTCLALILAMSAVTIYVFFQYQRQLRDLEVSNTSSFTRHYAFLTDDSGSFMQSIYQVAYQAGSKSGSYVEFTANDLDGNYTISQRMELAISSGVDGIILNGNDSDEIKELIHSASSFDIPVICIGMDSYGSERKSYVGISYYTLGQEYGRLISTRIDPLHVQNVMMLTGDSDHAGSAGLIYSGILDYIAAHGLSDSFAFETLSVGDGTMFSSTEAVTDLLVSDSLPDILICLDETNTTTVCQAIVDYNHVGDLAVFGYSTNDVIIDSITKNIIEGSISVSAKTLGERAVSCLDEYIENGFVTEYISIDFDTVTVKNVSEFEEVSE